jgi:hypothetical protein
MDVCDICWEPPFSLAGIIAIVVIAIVVIAVIVRVGVIIVVVAAVVRIVGAVGVIEEVTGLQRAYGGHANHSGSNLGHPLEGLTPCELRCLLGLYRGRDRLIALHIRLPPDSHLA